MNYQNSPVNVTYDKNGKLIIQTPEGLLKTYYLSPKRMIYLRGETLQTSMSSYPDYFPNDGRPDKPIELARQIEGRVVLKEQFISVIGDPQSRSNTLTIVFQPVTSDGREKDAETEQTSNVIPNYTRAWIKYIRLNQASGESPEWIAICAVSQDTLNSIASAVTSHSLRALTVGMMLPEGLYIDNNDDEENWMDDPTPIKEWYLRPSARDNTTETPECAYGGVTYLNLGLTDVNLNPNSNVKAAFEGPDTPAQQLIAVQHDRYAVSLKSIATNIQKIRFLATWIVGVLVLILLALTFKQH